MDVFQPRLQLLPRRVNVPAMSRRERSAPAVVFSLRFDRKVVFVRGEKAPGPPGLFLESLPPALVLLRPLTVLM